MRRRTGRPPRRLGLAARTALALTGVAALAVVLAGTVALQLIRGAAERQALGSLRQQAEFIAGVVSRGTAESLPPNSRVARLLRRQNISLSTVTPTGAVAGSGSRPAAEDVAAVRAGREVRRVRRVEGDRDLVIGLPTPGGGGVILLQDARVVRPVTAEGRRRTVLALVVGLVGAAAVGLLLARRLSRPLRRAAEAAHRMAAGSRDVELAQGGPAEVAALAEALNVLSRALATSESRQREFLLSISHELRTPLTAVKGFAEALADDVVSPADVPETGRTMLAEAARLERLVSDLLDLARLGAQDFRLDLAEVDLGEVVAQAAAVWSARSARVGVTLRTELPDRALPVRTDATRVRQILDGLAENALRVTPAGAPIVLAARRQGREGVLEVRDGGPGLTAEDLAVAFERSALYDRYRGVRRVGTGVGLALVAGLASRLGGTAQAGTAAEGGACFRIRLPLMGTEGGTGRGGRPALGAGGPGPEPAASRGSGPAVR